MIQENKSNFKFGKTMKRSRLNAGSTLGEMSKYTGLSPAYISSIENQRKRIKDSDVIKINDFFESLGVFIDWKSLADEANSLPLDDVVLDPNALYF